MSLFEENKKKSLSKKDLSKKGDVDAQIKPVCDLINSTKDYYTTSSCSGRIIILTRLEDGKKWDVEWLFSSHEVVELKEIKNVVEFFPSEPVWFKFDPVIIHVVAKTLDAAKVLLKLFKEQGFKRAGIINLDKHIIEVVGTERLEVPIARRGSLLIDGAYLAVLVEEANKKMMKNQERIDKLFRSLLNSANSKNI